MLRQNPPGCSWKYYLARHRDLEGHLDLEHTEEAALKHWINAGQPHHQICSCNGVDISDLNRTPNYIPIFGI